MKYLKISSFNLTQKLLPKTRKQWYKFTWSQKESSFFKVQVNGEDYTGSKWEQNIWKEISGYWKVKLLHAFWEF